MFREVVVDGNTSVRYTKYLTHRRRMLDIEPMEEKIRKIMYVKSLTTEMAKSPPNGDNNIDVER